MIRLVIQEGHSSSELGQHISTSIRAYFARPSNFVTRREGLKVLVAILDPLAPSNEIVILVDTLVEDVIHGSGAVAFCRGQLLSRYQNHDHWIHPHTNPSPITLVA